MKILLLFCSNLLLFLVSFASFSSSSTTSSSSSSSQLAKSINRLSIDFHRAVESFEQNVIFSPLSISIGLGLLLEGSQGESRRELMKFLGEKSNSTDSTNIRSTMKGILDRYSSNWIRWKLEMANLALISKNYKLREEYKKNIENDLKSKIIIADFSSNSSSIVDLVNNFVASNTDQLISKALDGPLDPETKLLIINTIAFDGEWIQRFTKSLVIERDFIDKNNQSTKIAFMTQTMRTNYAEISDKQMKILELEYVGNASMFILLPDEFNGLARLMDNLTMNEVDYYLQNNLILDDVDVEIPKFEYNAQYDLVALLTSLGLSTIFSSRSNFSLIADPNDIRLTGAVHKAMIKVDEKGTKAAAFSGFEFHPLSSMFGQNTFIADHPFIFLIRDKSNGINIFSGAVHKLAN